MKRGAGELPQAVQWHEGMLLAPQHFQQEALRRDELLNYHAQAISQAHYGLRSLSIDEGMLLSGIFRVLELEAVMPDGQVVSYGPGAKVAAASGFLELDLNPYAEALTNQEMRVKLTMPAAVLRSGDRSDQAPRFLSVPGPLVVDENTGDEEIEIPRLAPNLGLSLESQPSNRVVSLNICGLRFEAEAFRKTEYIPPLLEVEAAGALGVYCADIAARVRNKAMFLAGRLDELSEASAALLIEQRLTLHALVAALPRFEAACRSQSHPYALYLSLCDLVGSASILARDLLPPSPDPYDHDDLLRIFGKLREALYRIIEEGVGESYFLVPFKLDECEFSVELREEWLRGGLYIGGKSRGAAVSEHMEKWLLESVICSESLLMEAKDHRISGAPRRRIESDPDLPVSRDSILLQVDASSRFIRTGERLVVVNTADAMLRHMPGALYLYVKKTSDDSEESA